MTISRSAVRQALSELGRDAGERLRAVDDVEDVRPVPPPWHQLADLVEGARQRGWTEQQCEYLTAVIGVSFAKGFRAGQKSKEGT